LEDTTVLGYSIPKGVQVLANFWAVDHDPNVWKNPNEFNPNRFITEDNQFVKPEYFIPFSYGETLIKRLKICMKELKIVYYQCIKCYFKCKTLAIGFTYVNVLHIN